MSAELDPVIDGVLQRARVQASPDAAELAQALAGIQARIAAAPANLRELPDVAPPPDAPSLAPKGKVPSARWAAQLRRLLGTALTLGVGFAIGVQYARRSPSPAPAALPPSSVVAMNAAAAPSPALPPSRSPVPAALEPLRISEAPAAAVSGPAVAPAGRPPARAAAPLQPSRRAKRRVAPVAAQPAQERSSAHVREPERLDFAQVLDRLERAQRAERDLEPELALGLLDEIDARADQATLREERLVTRVLAACGVGDVAAAQRAAGELDDTAPASVYVSRVANSCAAPVSSRASSVPGLR